MLCIIVYLMFISNGSNNDLELVNGLIINIVESLKNIGQESIYRNKQDIKIGEYIPIEEIVGLRDSIITKIIDVLRIIAISHLNEDIYKYQEIILRIINYNGAFSLELITKKSNSIKDAMDSLYSFFEPLSPNNKLEKLKIASEILEIFNDISLRLIESKSINTISECAGYIKKISQWADKNEMPSIKTNAIKYLGHIGLDLVKSEIFGNDLRKINLFLQDIILINIEDECPESDIELPLNLLKHLAEKMAEKNINESEIDDILIFFRSLIPSISGSKAEELNKWINNFKK